MLLLATTICAAADRKQSSWDKTAKLKKAGYIELSGADAARFLIGKSVLVKNSGITGSPAIFYFLNDHIAYQCGVTSGSDCFVEPWGLKNDKICLELGSCDAPTTIMKSPHSKGQTNKGGKTGVYVWFGRYVYDVVQGDRTGGPRFDTHISGHPIELDRADFEKEIEDASHYSGGDKQVPISGLRASSLLIGNTFLSGDAAKYAKDQAMNACPHQGTYYSPDGKVIRFNCEGSPDPTWTIAVSHWKIESGVFCRDGLAPEDIGQFGCNGATVTATFVPRESGASDKMLVIDSDSGNALTGYAGNALNFRFENRPKLEKSEQK